MSASNKRGRLQNYISNRGKALKATRVIVIDDEKNICLSIKTYLEIEGAEVLTASTIEEALSLIRREAFDIAIIDIKLERQSGIELVKAMQNESIEIPFIFISGHASLDEAAETIKLGAYDFIEKPFSSERLLVTVNNCIEHTKLQNNLNHYKLRDKAELIIGESQQIKALKKDIYKVAVTDASILISGESGTGKELIAKSIHQHSKRQQYDFIVVNCSAIPENLIDSALFGHVKGAFTGAESHKKGYFELADGGTIFLDEIGDMSLNAQSSLLRVLENKQIQKVGAEKSQNVNVRVIAASHKDLKFEVDNGRFREDLFYRLNVIPLRSPALRERLEDMPLLATYLVGKICSKYGFQTKALSAESVYVLQQYHWPGNVRELNNIIERMVILGGQQLKQSDMPQDVLSTIELHRDQDLSTNKSLKVFKQQTEKSFLQQKLQECNGNVSLMAKIIEVDRTALHKKLNQHNIKR
jgi:DNA-binding NtrC family response regulator